MKIWEGCNHKVPQFGCKDCISIRGKLYDNNLINIATELQKVILTLSFFAEYDEELTDDFRELLFDTEIDLNKLRLEIINEAFVNTSENRYLSELVRYFNFVNSFNSSDIESSKS